MKSTILKYTAALSVVITLFSCKVDGGEHPRVSKTGALALRDAVEVVENYTGFARVGLAAMCYRDADAQKKIELLNSHLKGYTFTPIDRILQVTHGRRTFYVEFDPKSEYAVVMKITRTRLYDDNVKPVFDTCEMTIYGEDRLTGCGKGRLTLAGCETADDWYYRGDTRSGNGTLDITLVGENQELPGMLLIEGEGGYTNTDSGERTVEVDWKVISGLYDCFAADNYYPLVMANMEIEAGARGGKKDKVEAIYDMRHSVSDHSLEIKVNGRLEEGYNFR